VYVTNQAHAWDTHAARRSGLVEFCGVRAVDLPRPRPRSGAEVVFELIRLAINTRGVRGLYARAGRRLLVLRPPEVLLPGLPSSAGFHGFPVRSSI
jgi:hypothetical protein